MKAYKKRPKKTNVRTGKAGGLIYSDTSGPFTIVDVNEYCISRRTLTTLRE